MRMTIASCQMQGIQSLRIGNLDTTSQRTQHLHNVKQTKVSSYMYRTIVSLKQISQLSTHHDHLCYTVLFTESFNSKSAPACNNVIAMAVFLLRSAICNAGSGPTSMSHPFSSNNLQIYTSIVCHDSIITFLLTVRLQWNLCDKPTVNLYTRIFRLNLG